MEEWKLEWLDPIDGSDIDSLGNEGIPEERAGIYVWVHKPTYQVVYIGESDRIYSRVCDEVQLLRKGRWNIYDLKKEPDFAELLKKYSLPYEHPATVNETKMIFIPNQEENSKRIWETHWNKKVGRYLQNLRFFFCAGEWSSEKSKREALEATLLWGIKKHYAVGAGIAKLENDNDRISIGRIQGSDLSGRVVFIHAGNTDNLPVKIKEILC